MKAIDKRLNQIESQLHGRTTQQGFTIILDDNTVRVGGQVMTLEQYRRDVEPGLRSNVTKIRVNRIQQPVVGIDFRNYDD